MSFEKYICTAHEMRIFINKKFYINVRSHDKFNGILEFAIFCTWGNRFLVYRESFETFLKLKSGGISI